jgi:hypothetical protein
MFELGLLYQDDDVYSSSGVAFEYIGKIAGASGYHANLKTKRRFTEQEMITLSEIMIPAPTTPIRKWL